MVKDVNELEEGLYVTGEKMVYLVWREGEDLLINGPSLPETHVSQLAIPGLLASLQRVQSRQEVSNLIGFYRNQLGIIQSHIRYETEEYSQLEATIKSPPLL